MIPLFLALVWPPFAAASLRHRGERAAGLAMAVAAAGCLVAGIVWACLPAAAFAAAWLAASGVALLMARPAYPSRRQQRRQLLQREEAWGPVFDEARDELDSADKLVPVILRAPRRVK